MNCRNTRANFSSYLEQEMSELERRAMTAHLGRCSRCSSDLFAVQKTMSLLRWVPRVEGRPDFSERLMAKIRAEERLLRPAPSWLRLRLDDLGRRFESLGPALAAPAPVGALIAALVIGGGGGAALVGMIGGAARPPADRALSGLPETAFGPERREPAASHSEPAGPEGKALAPDLHRARIEGPGQLAAAITEPDRAPSSPASTPGEAGSRSRQMAPREAAEAASTPKAATSRQTEVAEWAAGGQRLEALPEGPPAIARVEYVLDLVDVNRRPVAATTTVRQEGSITF